MRKNRRYGERFSLKLLSGGRLIYLQAALAAFAVILAVVFLVNNVLLDNNTQASIQSGESTQGLSAVEPEVDTDKDLPEKIKKSKAEDVRPEKTPIREKSQERVEAPDDELRVEEKTVEAGQTVTDLLADHLSVSDIYYLGKQCNEVFSLKKIRSGNSYRLFFKEDTFSGFEYDIDASDKLCVEIEQGGFAVSKKNIEYEVTRHLVQGSIETSLFEAVGDSGEQDQLAIELADIFAWDIDFIRDIRKGDSFRLIVEKRYRKGEWAGYGDILAARFVNQGRTYQAFLFALDNGGKEYFNAKGQSVRKSFLKAPLHFSRISSGYTMRRMHPILKRVRSHQGIDYAAPRGTPVKSVGDGTVITRAYHKGNGNYLKVRHPNSYVTMYNHLSGFAKGIRRGKRVVQGEVIGYVGSTGLSTGPHLDYRVKKHGRYVNPLKVESTPCEPVPKGEQDRFFSRIKPLLAVLEGFQPLYAETEQHFHTEN
ncbi:MAG: peptidoglycan DD-metalloendopeptidase family protein [Desulfohalobiaceae bacterium]|nr:peptidoglycan DD-metalloendopeptidase family protein [Desulfohalobiaceae bacterium]